MPIRKQTIKEVDFCAVIASAINHLVAMEPTAYPFAEARVEGYGSGTGSRKRKDLRFFDGQGRVILCGEVKMPGTREGQSAMDHELMADAAAKADNAGVQYFFTWNVNDFVLWDRSLWNRPWFERRVRPWKLQRTLRTAEDVAREENLAFIKTRFLPDLLKDLADIVTGRRRQWGIPPDEFFIRSLESHLDWPVLLTAAHVLQQTESSKRFATNVEQWMTGLDWTFVRTPPEVWAGLVDNMAKTLAYVWANRMIFYKALRSRFPDLPRLEIRKSISKPDDALATLNGLFRKAVERSGDYEPLLMPDAADWATGLVFCPPGALDAWRGFLRAIEAVDFREVPSDVVGRIFQRLIGPEERRRYGQHFTGDDVVDLINCFCVRSGSDTVLDPACGSGSFLVRAYYRKRHLDPNRTHCDLIGELFGCDIAPYPAHLATLNLAARQIEDEANYPRIIRRNFFDYSPEHAFCSIPDGKGQRADVALPPLDAIVGNPPYVRQEKVEKVDKNRYGRMATVNWPDLHLTGRSDLHCYFWPVAASLLKPNGYFGFLTSSSWLDVEYGFALQGWLLRHFKILAIMESAAEPWFEDARVKTCATILQRCDDQTARMSNPVRFVRFSRKLSEIIGVNPTTENEGERQAALEKIRKKILSAKRDFEDHDLRIIVKTQVDLWVDGVRAGAILEATEEPETNDETTHAKNNDGVCEDLAPGAKAYRTDDYCAGKWGRYVRAPDIYFEIMQRFAGRFAAMGEIASIRRGITSGCDAFFMPKDVTKEMLSRHNSDRDFRENCGGVARRSVESGRVKIVKAGDGSVHPVESKYLAPEVHSLMNVDRPIVHAGDLDRLVLLVHDRLDTLKAKAPWVWRYLRYGMTASFASSKSKPVPIPERSTCAARDPWYDLTSLVKPGIAFWPMAQQYRHIVAANPQRLVCNHNLFDIGAKNLSPTECDVLLAVLNSTLVGLFKTFYGRYAGTEGNLKTEVVDVTLLEVPNPRGVSREVAQRLSDALQRLSKRPVGRLVEEQLMECHSPLRALRLAQGPPICSEELKQQDRRDLDSAVFELLGVTDPTERTRLLHRLYEATALHFRNIRVVEIQKMQQRSKSSGKRFSVSDLAADIWDAAELDDSRPLAEWLSQLPECDSSVHIPEERPVTITDSPLLPDHTVYFGKDRSSVVECKSGGQAELVARLALLGITNDVKIPVSDAACRRVSGLVAARIEKAFARFTDLSQSRTSDARIQRELASVLQNWFVLGRKINPNFSRG